MRGDAGYAHQLPAAAPPGQSAPQRLVHWLTASPSFLKREDPERETQIAVCCLLQEFGQFYLGKSSNYEADTSDELLKGWSLTSVSWNPQISSQ